MRDTIVSVLMSPHFCYRVDLPGAGAGIRPLSDYALASRLSYFLWSSMPDEKLLAHAAAGDLHRPEVLVAEARRMLRDDRIRGLATEFGGNWLDFRRFEEHNSVDRERFTDLQRRAAAGDVRGADPLLHRPGPERSRRPRAARREIHVRQRGPGPALRHARRRGLGPTGGRGSTTRAGMAAAGSCPWRCFLTKNSPGLRTSPVKRGYWVVRRLLGENIPAPPPNVPDLPSDEAKLGDLTLRQTLARHRADKSCASCHARFDSIGLAYEGYGPVGEFRTVDLGGRPVDTRATFPGGGEGDGHRGAAWLTSTSSRGEEFVDNLCRKLLAYGLGRSLLPSDDDTIETHAHAAGGRRRPFRQSGREHRHQPAVPEQASRKRHWRRNEAA